jgi:hypothetical protein
MKLIAAVCSLFLISTVSHAASIEDQVSKLLLPKLDKASKETQRTANEFLDEDLEFKSLKNKPGYGVALLRLNKKTPENDRNFAFEIYLLKTKPKLSVVAKGVFKQDDLCNCENDQYAVGSRVSDTTSPLGESDEALTVSIGYDTGGTGILSSETMLNAFMVKGDSLLKILSFKITEDSMTRGRPDLPEEEQPAGSDDFQSETKFTLTKKNWTFEGEDHQLLFRQTVNLKKVFVWNKQTQKFDEEKQVTYQSACTKQNIKKASEIAKDLAKKQDFHWAIRAIENVVKVCQESPSFSSIPWLESDLLLYKLKKSDYVGCIEDAKLLIQSSDFKKRPKEVQSAILHNKKLCEEKNKTPAL